MVSKGQLDELYCWIVRGSQRKIVLKYLSDEPITAQELRKKINTNLPEGVKPLSLREMSRHLTSFAEKGLAQCMAPNAPYSKPYRLNKIGLSLKNYLA